MKYFFILLMSCLALTGCGGTTTEDTVSDNSLEVITEVDEDLKVSIKDLLANPKKYKDVEFETVMVVDMTKEINGVKSLYSEHHIYNRIVFDTTDEEIVIGDTVHIRGTIGELESKMVENYEGFIIHLDNVEIIAKNEEATDLNNELIEEYEARMLEEAEAIDFETLYNNMGDYKVKVAKVTGTVGESSDFGYFAFVDDGILASTHLLPEDIVVGDSVTIWLNTISVSEQMDGVRILQVETLKIDKN